MSVFQKVKLMFSRKPAQSRELDPIEARIKTAVQRNESAGERAREALEEYQMSRTLRHIAGKM